MSEPSNGLTGKARRIGAWTGAILGISAIITGLVSFIVVTVRLVDRIDQQGQAILRLNAQVVSVDAKIENVSDDVQNIARALKYPRASRPSIQALEKVEEPAKEK